jgi:hypothetical protein
MFVIAQLSKYYYYYYYEHRNDIPGLMRGVSPLFDNEGPHPKYQEPWWILAEQAGAATPVEGCYKRKLLLY